MYLGIDLGTSEVKVLLLATDGSVIGTAGTPFTVSRPNPRWAEQNPLDWWDGTRTALFALREKFPAEFAQVRGIGLSGQMHGAVLLDAQRPRAAAGDPVERHAQRQGMRRTDRACAGVASHRRQSRDARFHRAEAAVGRAQRTGDLQADRLRAAAEGLSAPATDGHEGLRSIGRGRHAVARCRAPRLVRRAARRLRHDARADAARLPKAASRRARCCPERRARTRLARRRGRRGGRRRQRGQRDRHRRDGTGRRLSSRSARRACCAWSATASGRIRRRRCMRSATRFRIAGIR